MRVYLCFVGPPEGLDGDVEPLDQHVPPQLVLLTQRHVHLQHLLPLLVRQPRLQQRLAEQTRVLCHQLFNLFTKFTLQDIFVMSVLLESRFSITFVTD